MSKAERIGAIRECVRNGATVSEAVAAGDFPSKDALWVFCKRNGLRDEYMGMRAREDAVKAENTEPILRTRKRTGKAMSPAGKPVRLRHGVTVWRVAA